MVELNKEPGNTQEKSDVPKPSEAISGAKGTVRKRSEKLNPVPKSKITFKKLAKSRSNEFNVIIAPAILTILTSLGITIPLPVIISTYAIVNFILRLVTKGAIAEKG